MGLTVLGKSPTHTHFIDAPCKTCGKPMRKGDTIRLRHVRRRIRGVYYKTVEAHHVGCWQNKYFESKIPVEEIDQAIIDAGWV